MIASIPKDPGFWLSRVPGLSELGERERSILAAICDVEDYVPGSTIGAQDSRPASIPVLVEGTVDAVYNTSSSRIPVLEIKAPELVGFLWFLDKQTRSPVAFVAKSRCICLNIRTIDLENLYTGGNSLAYPVLATLYRHAASQFTFYNDAFRHLYKEPGDTYMQLMKLVTPDEPNMP
jgi:signal-transduction protein with cAMP-binding, CBS, and nucleotidyltransferase domain